MKKFFQSIFSCDIKSSRIEFYSYLILAFIPILISYLNWEYFYIDNNILWYVLSVVLLVCAIIRRAKDRGMKNEEIINFWAKISVLLVTGVIVFLSSCLYFGMYILNPKPMDFYLTYIVCGIGGIYLIVFLFPLLFLKGKETDEPEEDTSQEKKSLLKEIFNRDFFVNMFNFKGKTTREGSWLYICIVIVMGLIVCFKNNLFDQLSGWLTDFNTWFGTYYYDSEEVFHWEWWALLIVILLTLSLCCRRLRDLNIRPWKVVFLLIPPVNIFLFFLMIFGKSQR